MEKYCCFLCPATDYTEKELTDECPSCGNQYGFPLINPPDKIGDWKVKKSLDRGFYGAAYVVKKEGGRRSTESVIKISPKLVYDFFNKSFDEEITRHEAVAKGSNHIVKLEDEFDDVVVFECGSKYEIPCHVTVLEYIDGESLKSYLSSINPDQTTEIAQIAIDLLKIQTELNTRGLHHNDLHAGNLMVARLSNEYRRIDALSNDIIVKAIDLGSAAPKSLRGPNRTEDLAHISNHILNLLNQILDDPYKISDRSNRIGTALRSVVEKISSENTPDRRPSNLDLMDEIKVAVESSTQPWRPWQNPFRLKTFSSHYNAQTLDSWYVSGLIVDPDEQWLEEVTKPGPQIITGMRGCGKTMLLRAVDIHARLTRENSNQETKLDNVKMDGFVGLYVPASKIMELKEGALKRIEQRLAILFLSYSQEAARALMHIQDIDSNAITNFASKNLADSISSSIDQELTVDSSGLASLESSLNSYLNSSEIELTISKSPAQVFSALARTIKLSSNYLCNSTVYLLLDDVSTRHLEENIIGDLISALLFQVPECAFKLTSEWQTIELGLQSPGRIEYARIGRDLDIFDLGVNVLKRINNKGSAGKKWVLDILRKRARLDPRHPDNDPLELLGDISLEQVARDIGNSSSTSKVRKNAYRGISCLTKVCVGDIGDIIKLYDDIVQAHNSNSTPIPDHIQSTCFRSYSANRLYQLNQREERLKNHAQAFAEASHELLVRSVRKNNERTRQYTSLYVRITSTNDNTQKEIISKIRELIDSSVFVYAGGSPRTKTKDGDPILQFDLQFRKILGLNNFIPLSDRDRYELSGEALEQWINEPTQAKSILIRNQVSGGYKPDEDISTEPLDENTNTTENKATTKVNQSGLVLPKHTTSNAVQEEFNLDSRIRVKEITPSDLRLANLDTAVTALGFEDRSLASNEYLLRIEELKSIFAVRYELEGQSEAIRNLWKDTGVSYEEVNYRHRNLSLPNKDEKLLLDITGLTKPLIFTLVREQLIKHREVYICHAKADEYYPLQEDLEALFNDESEDDSTILLQRLSGVLSGESNRYDIVSLLQNEADRSLKRSLLAFASPKHLRLLSLLNKRDFDIINIITSEGNAPRDKVAQLLASNVEKDYPNVEVIQKDTNDLKGLIDLIEQRYIDSYSYSRANVEIGLTGSKMQAVAASAVSSIRRINEAWYVSPTSFDGKRFSIGTGDVDLYKLSISGF